MPVVDVIGRDFDAASGSWAAQMGLGEDGVLLVRPDGHILCVSKSVAETGAARLRQAIDDYVKPVRSIEKVA